MENKLMEAIRQGKECAKENTITTDAHLAGAWILAECPDEHIKGAVEILMRAGVDVSDGK